MTGVEVTAGDVRSDVNLQIDRNDVIVGLELTKSCR